MSYLFIFVTFPSVSESSIPAGQQFMIDLLLNSLMVEQDMEDALLTAIAYEMQNPEDVLKKVGMESNVPLMQLVSQLITNSTVRQLALLKSVSCKSTHSDRFTSTCLEYVRLVGRIQPILIPVVQLYHHVSMGIPFGSPPHPLIFVIPVVLSTMGLLTVLLDYPH